MSLTRLAKINRPKTGDKSLENGEIIYLFELPWQTAWLRTTALMHEFKPEGPHSHGSGIEDVLRKVTSGPFIFGGTLSPFRARSLVFYDDGGVVLTEGTLAMFLPSPYHFAAFQIGDERGFFDG